MLKQIFWLYWNNTVLTSVIHRADATDTEIRMRALQNAEIALINHVEVPYWFANKIMKAEIRRGW